MTIRLSTHRPGALTAFVRAVASHVARASQRTWAEAETLYLRMQTRHGIRQMLELDDRMLRDIGVTRGEVMRAANMPLHENAGETLRRISLTRSTMGPG